MPAETEVTKDVDRALDFPNGTILTKTFFYHLDERSPGLGKRVIETRLLIKQSDVWDLAAYKKIENQSAAILVLGGFDTPVSWINSEGENLSTIYHMPSQNECITCHQLDNSLTPIGPKLRNLNRSVTRNNVTLNQIEHLQSTEILSYFDHSQLEVLSDYKIE